MNVWYTAIIPVLFVGNAIAQDDVLPRAIFGPEARPSEYSYQSRVSDRGSRYLEYIFCNQRQDRNMSFAWIAAGFGVRNEAALVGGACAEYTISSPDWGITNNSPLVLSGGIANIPQTYVYCSGVDCGDDEGSLFPKMSLAELKAEVLELRGPERVGQLSIQVETNPDMGMRVVWDLPPMNVALVIARPFTDDLHVDNIAGEPLNSAGALSIRAPEFSELISDDYLAVAIFNSFEERSGNVVLSIPPDLIERNAAYLLGVSDGRSAQFVMRIPWEGE